MIMLEAVSFVKLLLLFLFTDSSCLNVNCGGKDAAIKENNQKVFYVGDGGIEGGTARLFLNSDQYWGFSSTGDFMDDGNFQNVRYTASLVGSNLNELDSTARIAPISITYFHYCLENGNYTVRLRFSEIQFTDDDTYSSLGKRVFNIYVQVRENLGSLTLWQVEGDFIQFLLCEKRGNDMHVLDYDNVLGKKNQHIYM